MALLIICNLQFIHPLTYSVFCTGHVDGSNIVVFGDNSLLAQLWESETCSFVSKLWW